MNGDESKEDQGTAPADGNDADEQTTTPEGEPIEESEAAKDPAE